MFYNSRKGDTAKTVCWGFIYLASIVAIWAGTIRAEIRELKAHQPAQVEAEVVKP
jgi:hypothetical protein